MGLGGAKRSRSPSDASPVAFCLLCRHGQSRSPPALRPQARFGAQPPRQRRLLARRWRRNSPARKSSQRPDEGIGPYEKNALLSPPHPSGLTASHLPPRGKAFGRPSEPPLRRKGRFSGGEDTAPTEKRMLVGAPVGHSGVPKWAGFPPPPAGRAPLAHKFLKTGHPGPPGGAGSGWPLKKRQLFSQLCGNISRKSSFVTILTQCYGFVTLSRNPLTRARRWGIVWAQARGVMLS